MNEENVNIERREVKLDRTLLYINGIKELPFLIQIMTVLEIQPGPNLDITNRRSVNRALLRFLNDPDVLNLEINFEQKLDEILNVCDHYFAEKREETLQRAQAREQNDVRLRNPDGHIDIEGIGPALENHDLNEVFEAPDEILPELDLLNMEENAAENLQNVQNIQQQQQINNVNPLIPAEVPEVDPQVPIIPPIPEQQNDALLNNQDNFEPVYAPILQPRPIAPVAQNPLVPVIQRVDFPPPPRLIPPPVVRAHERREHQILSAECRIWTMHQFCGHRF